MGGPVRPSGYIGWASATGVTNIVEPTDAQKQMGWAQNQTPPSSYENWLRQMQDQSLSYLRWRMELDVIVRDDFVRIPFQVMNAYAATGFGAVSLGYTGYNNIYAVNLQPNWYAFISPAATNIAYQYSFQDGSTNLPSVPASAGVISIQAPSYAVGPAEMYARVGTIGSKDFRMEFVVADFGRAAGDAGGAVGLGLFYEASGLTGPCPQLGFFWTGSSGGAFGARWIPSGAAVPTGINLGVASGWSGFHKLCIESRSPTMAFYLDDVVVGAVPAVAVGPIPRLNFGLQAGAASGSTNFQWLYLDKAELLVRRGPGTPV